MNKPKYEPALPPTTHVFPLHAIADTLRLIPTFIGVQLIPFVERANTFVPCPPAKNTSPLLATEFPCVENTELPNPVHLIPSLNMLMNE